MVKNKEDLIETRISNIQRIYLRPAINNTIVMDMLVDLECGGSIFLTGLRYYEHGSVLSVNKQNILGYEEPKEGEKSNAKK